MTPLPLLALLAATTPEPPLQAALPGIAAELRSRHGEAQRARIERGLRQAVSLWRRGDGDAAAFRAFARAQFVSDPAALEDLFHRLEHALEQLDGSALEVNRTLRWHADLDLGPLQPVDSLLAALDASAHLGDDLFGGKVAFAALLNFRLTTLEERLREGQAWSPRQWAEARLAGRFARRVPAEVNQAIARAAAAADLYISRYNLYPHHLVAGSWEKPERPFPRGPRLLAHWNLRDQVKAEYAAPGGLPRQRLLARAMERIAAQEIPAAVVDDPAVDWNPLTNEVRPAPPGEVEGGARPPARVSPAREPDARYAHVLDAFRAQRRADPFSPTAPTFLARKFELEREMPEARVVALLEEVLASPLGAEVARLAEARLGRPLEPFDVWYDGFRPRARFAEAELDARTRARWPTARAFEEDLPRILEAIGFAPERARFLAEHVAVDPARGSGHAMEAGRRGDKPRLRTRVGPGGMDYKGFNIAVHELGHNVEQVFSLYAVPSTLLAGVPGNAFTEAIAFVFQSRDLQVLGLSPPDAAERRLAALSDFWATREIAGVALVDLRMWRWLYQHPRATPGALRQATLGIAREVWNRHFAPLLGGRDSVLLAVYSHMVSHPLYLADYPLGHLVAAQIEAALAGAPSLGAEVERMASQGRLTPDLWMERATGAPVSARALLSAAEEALRAGDGAGR
ncbi:MAG TPA: hypothetical protein VFF02_19015 [Anaeromyxobacteraceae bacterium]|nr:hypothetical protein [Anaeromyxobacteraceae bacterium]